MSVNRISFCTGIYSNGVLFHISSWTLIEFNIFVVLIDPLLSAFVFLCLKQTDRYLFQLEQSLRSFLLKINMADSLLTPLPADCTWTVHATTSESAAARRFDTNLENNFPWLEASEKETTMDNASILPLKSTTSPYINMQMYVEESKECKDSWCLGSTFI